MDLLQKDCRNILLFGLSESFDHQGPEHGHIDNCQLYKQQQGISQGTSHSSHGGLQYLLSLQADLADTAQGEGDGADESVASASIDNEGEASACVLGI